MTRSKLKKYVGKTVRVHFRYSMGTADGIVVYRENAIPSCKYSLFQLQNSGYSTYYYTALDPKYIGHIEESSEMKLFAQAQAGIGMSFAALKATIEGNGIRPVSKK